LHHGDCNPRGLAVMLAATTGLQRAWDVMAVKRSGDRTGLEEAPHYHGHRERLRARFREAGATR
jgi:DNA repair protein RadC